jgi:hypothetical protein
MSDNVVREAVINNRFPVENDSYLALQLRYTTYFAFALNYETQSQLKRVKICCMSDNVRIREALLPAYSVISNFIRFFALHLCQQDSTIFSKHLNIFIIYFVRGRFPNVL